MTDSKYGMRRAEQREMLPAIDLLPVINHQGNKLDVAVFGPSNYKTNLGAMSKAYFHSAQLPNISFRPAKTSESISTAAYGFGGNGSFDAKRDILDPRWLQLGPIVRTQDGVFTNTTEIDDSRLKQLLNSAEKVNGIYLIDEKVAFAPYESFERGVQDCDTFTQGGLARILEHTPEKEAGSLRVIASPRFYKKGVNVKGFDDVTEPILSVASLGSSRSFGDCELDVYGGWSDDYIGFAFGGLDESAEGASQKGK